MTMMMTTTTTENKTSKQPSDNEIAADKVEVVEEQTPEESETQMAEPIFEDGEIEDSESLKVNQELQNQKTQLDEKLNQMSLNDVGTLRWAYYLF